MILDAERYTIVRMTMRTSETSEAARQLARSRWGTRRLNRVAEEVADRARELAPEQLEHLRAAIAADPPKEHA